VLCTTGDRFENQLLMWYQDARNATLGVATLVLFNVSFETAQGSKANDRRGPMQARLEVELQ